jgi:hypothetical protein
MFIGVAFLQQLKDGSDRRSMSRLLDLRFVSQVNNSRTVTGAADAGIQYESISISPADSI